eukprot:4834764-Amphidinium_carterae.1
MRNCHACHRLSAPWADEPPTGCSGGLRPHCCFAQGVVLQLFKCPYLRAANPKPLASQHVSPLQVSDNE